MEKKTKEPSQRLWKPKSGEFVIWEHYEDNKVSSTFDVIVDDKDYKRYWADKGQDSDVKRGDLFVRTIYVIKGSGISKGIVSFVEASRKDVVEHTEDSIRYALGDMKVRKATPEEIKKYKELSVIEAI